MLLGHCYLAVLYSASALADSGAATLLLAVPVVTVFSAAQLEWRVVSMLLIATQSGVSTCLHH
jgi:hypothetical protein